MIIEIIKCKDQCEAYDPTAPLMSECDFKLELLKQDMSPGGQYFDNLPEMYLPAPDVNTLNTNYDENNEAIIKQLLSMLLNVDPEKRKNSSMIKNYYSLLQ